MKQTTYDIIIPKLSDEIIDCQITRWLVDVGDFVREGDILVELETEKTTIEIESPTSGILEGIYVFEDEEVIASERIGVINILNDLDDDDKTDFSDDEDEKEIFANEEDEEDDDDNEEDEDEVEEDDYIYRYDDDYKETEDDNVLEPEYIAGVEEKESYRFD